MIYIALGIQIVELIFYSHRKQNTILLILDLIDLILTISYIIILQHLEDIYKAKNYNKSALYAKILIGLDSSSILLGLISINIHKKKK